MNTPAHLLLGAAVMGQRHGRNLTWAALAGSLLPDLSLYVLAGVSLFVQGIPAQVVFDELYFSDAWQAVFAVDNSFLVWGALLALALWRRFAWAIALTGAALLHVALDFPLHHDDGRPHFWPLSNWVFESPISYWDRANGAIWFGPLEVALGVICAIILWCRNLGWLLSGVILVLLMAQLWISHIWLFVFIDG